jgi:uncharacterized membrane protein
MLNRIRYFLVNNSYEIIAALISLGIVLTTIYFGVFPAKFLSISVIIIIIGFVAGVYSKSKKENSFFTALNNPKNKDDWIGEGQFNYSRVNKCFHITESDDGYIFSKCLDWIDYEFSFDFNIKKNCLGAILRATNLTNYVMMQITLDGIRPHIRIAGAWNYAEAKDSGLSFDKKLSLDLWYKCELVCDKNIVYIKIFDEEKQLVFNREWNILKGNIQILFQDKNGEPAPSIPIPIDLHFGAIGFRAGGNEKALVRNVKVRKL